MKPVTVNVDVNINDVVTPKSCSTLICEIMKYLIYNREQIPYTYDRLKYLVTKRKELLSKISDQTEEEKISLHSRIAAERQYSKAEDTFTNLETVFKLIQSEMETQTTGAIEEVVLIFGATPLHPQNMFRIPIPLLAFGHNEDCHPHRKHLPSLFQSLVSSEGLNKIFNQRLSPTNIFVLLKMKEALHPTSEMFLRKDDFYFPARNPQINFILKDNLQHSCSCNKSEFQVFCDTPSRHCNVDNVVYTQPVRETANCNPIESNTCESDDDNLDCNWFQYSSPIKGFKDLKVDGTSVANLWLKHIRPYSLTS